MTVVECDNPEAPTEALIVEKQPKDGDVFGQVPFALTPGPPINTKPLQESIAETAALVAAGLPNLPADAVDRHPAAPQSPHGQRRTAPAHRR